MPGSGGDSSGRRKSPEGYVWPSTPEELAPVDMALSRLPTGLYVMTSTYEDDRAGIRALSVQPCGHEPRLVCVAVRKGHAIEPIIRDARTFAVCVLDDDDRLVARKFPVAAELEGDEDPFASLPVGEMATGCPVIMRGRAAMDCEVVRHFDLESDHELYIGAVLEARVFDEPAEQRG